MWQLFHIFTIGYIIDVLLFITFITFFSSCEEGGKEVLWNFKNFSTLIGTFWRDILNITNDLLFSRVNFLHKWDNKNLIFSDTLPYFAKCICLIGNRVIFSINIAKEIVSSNKRKANPLETNCLYICIRPHYFKFVNQIIYLSN